MAYSSDLCTNSSNISASGYTGANYTPSKAIDDNGPTLKSLYILMGGSKIRWK